MQFIRDIEACYNLNFVHLIDKYQILTIILAIEQTVGNDILYYVLYLVDTREFYNNPRTNNKRHLNSYTDISKKLIQLNDNKQGDKSDCNPTFLFLWILFL